MGDVLVGFDKDAFCSFGLEQAHNASMSEVSTREYVDKLKYLIKNHSRKMANALVVHWFKKAVTPENDPLAFLFEPPEIIEASGIEFCQTNSRSNPYRPTSGTDQ